MDTEFERAGPDEVYMPDEGEEYSQSPNKENFPVVSSSGQYMYENNEVPQDEED